MKIKVFLVFSILNFLCLDAFAFPGGFIFEVVERSLMGKVIITILVILLLPLITYYQIKEKIKIRKTFKSLKFLSENNENFNWFKIKNRAKDCFLRINDAWSKEDMELASDWMTNWYWQNQQLVFINNWERQGLINVCRINKINRITPIHIEYKNEVDNSRLIIKIDANVEDYLRNRETKEIIQGKRGYQDVTTFWTFVLKNDKWLVENIEEGNLLFDYLEMKNVIPSKIKVMIK